jgi:hypothetical protein
MTNRNYSWSTNQSPPRAAARFTTKERPEQQESIGLNQPYFPCHSSSLQNRYCQGNLMYRSRVSGILVSPEIVPC